ncbi:hypothetical protein [Devosia epidermidihirudinis]|uniref:hypothetical protein n=1 Tax=Devosia epidermidihirudinis TaxID=1293439 RepID=UPI000A7A5027|nr:hypothetical protein [Devosia epidermidihirudinis]
MNKEWHEAHPMPPNATLDQRVSWHIEHAKACACRSIPDSVLRELERRGIAAPSRGKV